VNDEWGHNPQVQMMRRVFAAMENVQSEYLRSAGVGPYDPGLRRTRDIARLVFERAWPTLAGRADKTPEEEAGVLYLSCLKYALRKTGVFRDDTDAGEDERFDRLIRGYTP